MKRHRRRAILSRPRSLASFSGPDTLPIPRGPRYSEEASNQQRARFFSLRESQLNLAEQGATGSHLPEERQMGIDDEKSSEDTSGENSPSGTPSGYEEQYPNAVVSPYSPVAPSFSIQYSNDRSSIVGEVGRETGAIEMDDLAEEEGDEDDSSDVIGDRSRLFYRQRFFAWCSQNKKWIDFAVKNALTDKSMDDLLSLIGSPYKSWKTVKRNLNKYAGMETATFLSCRGHMLLGTSQDEEEAMVCTVCARNNSVPDITSFEYLPLLPRVRSWVNDETSFNELFGNRDSGHANGESSKYYEDFESGLLYQRISEMSDNNPDTYEIYIAPSCDGFQTFANRSYDCWPLVAMNHNLPVGKRFLMKNIVPLGFIKGPRETVRLDTFFRPLVEEVNAINANGGQKLRFFDGSMRRVRVILLWATGDLPAVAKMAGVTGSNGKSPCRFCEFIGVRRGESRHYYFPSEMLVVQTNEEGDNMMDIDVRFDPHSLPLRTFDGIQKTWQRIEDAPNKRQRDQISTETGVKARTSLFAIPTLFPFWSFPIDSMHLIMNKSKDLMELWKGDNSHLKTFLSDADDFVLGKDSCDMIDTDIAGIGKKTCHSAFGPKLRATDCYSSWKAVEYREFMTNYCLVVMEGHLHRRYMDGLVAFSSVIELCSRPAFSERDLEMLGKHALDFFLHFEKEYYRYMPERIGLCKSTPHLLLHLKECVEACWPLVLYSQWWVERYVGFVKHRLHASVRAAESLTENARFLESYKMFFNILLPARTLKVVYREK